MARVDNATDAGGCLGVTAEKLPNSPLQMLHELCRDGGEEKRRRRKGDGKEKRRRREGEEKEKGYMVLGREVMRGEEERGYIICPATFKCVKKKVLPCQCRAIASSSSSFAVSLSPPL